MESQLHTATAAAATAASEEHEVLQAIYAQDLVIVNSDHTTALVSLSSHKTRKFYIKLPYPNDAANEDDHDHHVPRIAIHFDIPVEYPSVAPHVTLILPNNAESNAVPYRVRNLIEECMRSRAVQIIIDSCRQTFQANEVCVYQWVEYIREHLTDDKIYEELLENIKQHDLEHDNESSKSSALLPPKINTTEINDSIPSPRFIFPDALGVVSASLTIPLPITTPPTFFVGTPVTDRKSTFQAFATALSTPNQISTLISALKSSHSHNATATHTMFAYRWKDSEGERSKSIENYEDDGEIKAGKRLLYLLEMMDVYNVLIIVQRWFGGIQLGADRFKHITQVAQVLLKDCSLDRRVLPSK